MRMFSIPYNGTNPNEYLNAIEPYKEHIANIFLGLSWVVNNFVFPRGVNNLYNLNTVETYEDNTKQFLEKSKGLYKRIVTINNGCYHFTYEELEKFCNEQLFPELEKYAIEGVIVTDFNMGTLIRKKFPNIEIHTSCNCFQWNIHQMQLWDKALNIAYFNPPREILRTPSALKEMKKYGFKIKAIINEACLYGCPWTINHCMYVSNDVEPHVNCGKYKVTGTGYLQCNWVIPRWLKQLDEYVDIYKISGRGGPTELLIRILDAFVNELDDIPLYNAVYSNYQYNKMPLYNLKCSDIPDKLLTCECKDCSTCHLCDKVIEKALSIYKEDVLVLTTFTIDGWENMITYYINNYKTDKLHKVQFIIDKPINKERLHNIFVRINNSLGNKIEVSIVDEVGIFNNFKGE